MEADLVDLLPGLRSGSDLGWALAHKPFPSPRPPANYTAPEDNHRQSVITAVLQSKRVEAAVAQSAEPRDTVLAQAREIAEEMGHNFGLGSVRGVGFVIHKAFQRMFSGIWTNIGAVDSLKSLSQTTPVLFLPSHRSYIDFLLLTYLCYTLDLRPPVIAAGMDFLGMKGVGEALRRCGAFFIRRSFGLDRVYWAVFCEYIDRLVKDGEHPIEFFIEGTRSRSGKALPPKTGLLGAALEPFLRREVFDVAVVPVSISYSRILEERLYAYELLGFPKPPESTSGLLKARTVLHTDLGNVVLRFCPPISARQYFRSKVTLGLPHNLSGPGGWEATTEERIATKHLALHVIGVHQSHRVQTAWGLLCLCLVNGEERDWTSLLGTIGRMIDLLARLGSPIALLHAQSLPEEVEYYLQLHSNLVERRGSTLHLLPLEESPQSFKAPPHASLPSSVIKAALTPMALGAYAAGCLCTLRDLAFLATANHRLRDTSPERLRQEFVFLRTRLFALEFVSESVRLDSDFEWALAALPHAREEMLYTWLQPFLVAYQSLGYDVAKSGLEVTFRTLASASAESESTLVGDVQARLHSLIETRAIPPWHHILSRDIVRNALAAARYLGLKPGDGMGAFVLIDRIGRLLPHSHRSIHTPKAKM